MSIKTKLIHLLGGLTQEVCDDRLRNAFDNGKLVGGRMALSNLKQFADNHYGLNADEWCTLMYNKIKKCIVCMTDLDDPLSITRHAFYTLHYSAASAEDAPASTEATNSSIDPEQLQRSAIESSRPRYHDGGVLIPALGIILDLNPLSESAKWDEAMELASANGKRLPIIDEWHYICYHRDEINKIIKKNGGTELSSIYWSSTENSASDSWIANLFDGYIDNVPTKYNYFLVRAVAAFNS